MSQRPRAFRLDRPDIARAGVDEPAPTAPVVVTEEPFDAIEAADGVVVPVARRRRAPWLAILMSALGGLVTLAIGLGVERLIADLFAVTPWLGWVALGLAVLAAIALAGIVGRELGGVLRERKIERLRAAAADALAVRDHQAAKAVAAEVVALYAARAEGGAARERVRALGDEIIDADDRLAIVERELIAPLDAQAKRAIADGDSLLQQVLGLGLAARVSAKLGEGVLNGLLTARFGLAALSVCRPLPFVREAPPRIGDVAGELLSAAQPGRPDGPL
jgi:putative membrane protein